MIRLASISAGFAFTTGLVAQDVTVCHTNPRVAFGLVIYDDDWNHPPDCDPAGDPNDDPNACETFPRCSDPNQVLCFFDYDEQAYNGFGDFGPVQADGGLTGAGWSMSAGSTLTSYVPETASAGEMLFSGSGLSIFDLSFAPGPDAGIAQGWSGYSFHFRVHQTVQLHLTGSVYADAVEGTNGAISLHYGTCAGDPPDPNDPNGPPPALLFLQKWSGDPGLAEVDQVFTLAPDSYFFSFHSIVTPIVDDGVAAGRTEVEFTGVLLGDTACGSACDVSGGDADVDGDCVVNIADLGVVLANFNETGGSHEAGDTNFDGMVNIADLGNVLARFNTTCTP